MAAFPDKYLDLFQKKAFANLATLMPDGSPQVTPVWIDFDGTHVLVNSARGRQKDKNMQKNGSVASDLIAATNSKPSMCGMLMSVTIRSGGFFNTR